MEGGACGWQCARRGIAAVRTSTLLATFDLAAPSRLLRDGAGRGSEEDRLMTTPRRALLALIAPLALTVACETPPSRLPRSTALPPPSPADLANSEPAPVPSEAASDFVAARREGLAPLPTGSNAMPDLDAAQRLGTDMTTAPMPADPVRRPQR
jgi:hypothetical protein